MEINDDNLDRIDAYLRGEMSPGERAKFEADLDSNPELVKEFRQTKAIADAIADRRRKLDSMALWSDMEQSHIQSYAASDYHDPSAASGHRVKPSQRGIAPSVRSWGVIAGCIAACLAVAFFVLRPMFFGNVSDRSLPASPEFSSTPINRGAAVNDSRLDSLTATHNYAAALQLIETEISDLQNSISALDNADTMSQRDTYRRIQYELELYQLQWQRINLLLKLERTEECRQALEGFVGQEGEYRTQADSLLQSIN